jgi:hypothetical protein
MAFNPAPTLFFGTSYSENGTVLSIPISGIPELSAAEADAASGDSRKLIWALIDHLCTVYTSLASASRPSKMRLQRSYGQVDPATGNFTANYSMSFNLTASGLEMADE